MATRRGKKIFATGLRCIDGRPQRLVDDWIMASLGVDYVDNITEAGMDGFLARGGVDVFHNKLCISITVHQSRHIVVVGHDDCTGNQMGIDNPVIVIDDQAECSKISRDSKGYFWGFLATIFFR